MKYYVEIINRIELSLDYHLFEIHEVSFASNPLFRGDRRPMWRASETVGDVKTRKGKTKRESRWEATKEIKSSGSPGELYRWNFITRSGRFTFFQPPICAREAKWEHFKDGKPLGEKQSRRQWGGQTSFCNDRMPSRTSFLSWLQTFIFFTDAFFYRTKNVIGHTTVSCLILQKLRGTARNGAEKRTSAIRESTRKYFRVKYSFTVGPYKCVRSTSWRSYLQQDWWILHGHVAPEVTRFWLWDYFTNI